MKESRFFVCIECLNLFKSYFHKPSIFVGVPLLFFISSSPFRIMPIIAGDCIIYSVFLVELYSSKEIITTLAFPER